MLLMLVESVQVCCELTLFDDQYMHLFVYCTCLLILIHVHVLGGIS